MLSNDLRRGLCQPFPLPVYVQGVIESGKGVGIYTHYVLRPFPPKNPMGKRKCNQHPLLKGRCFVPTPASHFRSPFLNRTISTPPSQPSREASASSLDSYSPASQRLILKSPATITPLPKILPLKPIPRPLSPRPTPHIQQQLASQTTRPSHPSRRYRHPHLPFPVQDLTP